MTVRSAKPDDYDQIYRLLDKAFRKSPTEPALCEQTIVKVVATEDPSFRQENLRVVEVDGKIVSMMLLTSRPLRIGSALVNHNIVAPVATDPREEKKGYCSAVMRDAVEYMKEADFDLSLLWGVPWLYPHYGYSSSLPYTQVVIRSSFEPFPDQGWTFDSLKPEHVPEVRDIYLANTEGQTCAEVRSGGYWEWKPRLPQVDVSVVKDRSNNVIGYCMASTLQQKRHIAEVGVGDDTACRAIFNKAIEIAKRAALDEIICAISPIHPFARFAFDHNAQFRISRGGGAGMVRVINLRSLFENMESELDRRLGHSRFHNWTGSLLLESDEGRVLLNVEGGKVSIEQARSGKKPAYILRIPLLSLNPLITGFKDITALLGEPGVSAGNQETVELVQALFPPGYPHWSTAAYYLE